MSTIFRPGAGRAHLARLLALLVFAVLLQPAPSAHAVAGTDRYFWVQRSTGWLHVKCHLVARGAGLRLYAAARGGVSAAEGRSIATQYEQHIFPTDTRLFGLPSRMGLVNVLLVPLDGVTMGYFDENDLLLSRNPLSDPAHSNFGNVLYVRLPRQMRDRPAASDVGEVIAHELQHLITYRIRVIDRHLPPQEQWLNEGLSFYAQIANGFWTPRDQAKVAAAAGDPSWPVTSLSSQSSFLAQHGRTAYGRAGMFVTYLAARFGPGFIRSLVADRQTGMAGVADLLARMPGHPTLESVYADWGVAQVLNSRGRFGFGAFSSAARIQPALLTGAVTSYPFDSSRLPAPGLMLHPWGQAFIRFDGTKSGDLQIVIDGPEGRLAVAAIVEDSARALPVSVRTLHCDERGRATVRIPNFGQMYDRVVVTVSDVSDASSSADPVRIRAALARMRSGESAAGQAQSSSQRSGVVGDAWDGAVPRDRT